MLYWGSQKEFQQLGQHIAVTSGSVNSRTTLNGYQKLKWKSSNPSVAKINEETGELEALSVGTTTLILNNTYYFGEAKQLEEQLMVTVE